MFENDEGNPAPTSDESVTNESSSEDLWASTFDAFSDDSEEYGEEPSNRNVEEPASEDSATQDPERKGVTEEPAPSTESETPQEKSEKPAEGEEAEVTAPENAQDDEQQTQPDEQQGVWSEEEFAKAHQKYLGELEGTYRLADEDMQAFNEDPAGYLPKLAAKLHANVFQEMSVALGNVLQNQLPAMIQSTQREATVRDTLWNEYQSQWNDLASPEYHDTISQVTKEVLAKKPNLKPKEAAKEIGVQVWLRTGKSAGELVNRLAEMEAGATASQQQPAQGSAERQPQGGYAPPSAGRTAEPPAGRQPENPFEGFAQQILQEELD